MAEYLDVSSAEIIKKLMALGEMKTLTQTLSDETITVLASELGQDVEIVHSEDEEVLEPRFDDAEEDLVERPPVVTIMGHVDHGKTSLLDAIRQTQVAAGEAGGITQHIGAYQVNHDGKPVTFLDTPGHEAFTAMRARGAKVTDIAVIVVAADDGVKPQTQEAVDHAKLAEVPMLVAVNKIDKEGAQPDRVRTEMTQLGLQPVEWGGDTEFVNVSAKTKEGLDDLLDTILLMSEVEELRSKTDAPASGTVIESKLDPGRGPVVTILIGRGTLEVGDSLVAGAHWGRVRAMNDFMGNRVGQALPGEPVEVLGFDGVPEAGEHVRAVENERRARQLAGERATRLKTESLARRAGKKISLESIFEAGVQELNLVVKADVAGSLEAIEDEIAKLPQEEVSVNVIRRAVGAVTESDVMLAAASDAVILAFNVRPVGDARAVADREGVEIRHYSVIYRAIDELRSAMQGMLAPEEVEETLGLGRGPPDLPRLPGRDDRRIARHRRQDHPRLACAPDPRRHRRLRRRDRQPTALQRGRPRSRFGIRLRHRAARLRRPQGRRRARGLHHPSGRARARLTELSAGVPDVRGRLRRCAGDRPALPGFRQPQEQAQGAVFDQGPAARAPRRSRLRDRPPRPVAAGDADRRADERVAGER